METPLDPPLVVSTDWLPLPMAPLMIFMSLVQAHEQRSKVSTCPNPTKLMALACNDYKERVHTFSEGVSPVTNVPTVRLEATVGSMNIIKAIRRRGALRPPLKGGHPSLIPPPPPPVTRLWGEARAKTATFFRNAGLETVSHCV